ncbi:MAG: hypothetical protein U1E39_10950 [Planctomycetota bacterium]
MPTPTGPLRAALRALRVAGGLVLWLLTLLFVATLVDIVHRGPRYSSYELVFVVAVGGLCFAGGAALLRPTLMRLRAAESGGSAADRPRPRILDDARRRPGAFCWRGEVGAADRERIRAWLGPERPLPDDLWRLLGATGGGMYFESESLLSLAPNAADDDPWDPIDEINAHFWSAGMPRSWVAFSIGAGIAVVDAATGTYLDVDGKAWTVRSRHTTLDAWYVAVPRVAFGRKYGLG